MGMMQHYFSMTKTQQQIKGKGLMNSWFVDHRKQGSAKSRKLSDVEFANRSLSSLVGLKFAGDSVYAESSDSADDLSDESSGFVSNFLRDWNQLQTHRNGTKKKKDEDHQADEPDEPDPALAQHNGG